jgi:aspartate-semialdehyde dehydrogenase
MPKSNKGFRVGIVNPSTLVGAEIKAILEERGFHYDQVDLLDSTGDDAGALTEVADEAAVVQQISRAGLEPLDIVFFTGPAASNAEWLAAADDAGCLSIDVSIADTTREGIPIVSGVNSGSIADDRGRIVSPHPAAIPLILVLDRVRALSSISSGVATILQPASRFGKAGIDELFQQTIQALNMTKLPHDVFDRQAAFNLFPAADADRAESLVRSDLIGVLGRMPIALSLIQGPTFHGHSLALFVRTEEPITLDQLRRSLASVPSLEIEDDPPASSVDAGGRDAALVGRMSADPAVENGFWIWVVCDNLRRGAALNAVEIAEQVVSTFHWTN